MEYLIVLRDWIHVFLALNIQLLRLGIICRWNFTVMYNKCFWKFWMYAYCSVAKFYFDLCSWIPECRFTARDCKPDYGAHKGILIWCSWQWLSARLHGHGHGVRHGHGHGHRDMAKSKIIGHEHRVDTGIKYLFYILKVTRLNWWGIRWISYLSWLKWGKIVPIIWMNPM